MTQLEAVKKALEALKSAPTKYRIDFDPYWWWYDSVVVPTIKLLEEHLGEQNFPNVGQSGTSGSENRELGASLASDPAKQPSDSSLSEGEADRGRVNTDRKPDGQGSEPPLKYH